MMRCGLFALLLLVAGSIDATFVHPGVGINRGQLDFVKAKIAAGAQPWKHAFDVAVASQWGSKTYKPTPFTTVNCGSFNIPNIGCTQEVDDGAAAFTQAVLWYYTTDTTYLHNAIHILDSWSAANPSHINSNQDLQSSWVAAYFTRAAEIVRYTSTAWPAANIQRFATMLTTKFLPLATAYNRYNNWEFAQIESIIGIAVFTDNAALLQQGISLWRTHLPAYIYMRSDGALPLVPPGQHWSSSALLGYWYDTPNKTPWVNGRTQETCRDFIHLGLAIASITGAAETALIQGVDLYSEQATRLVAAMEYAATIVNNWKHGVHPASTWCSSKPPSKIIGDSSSYDIGYNALAVRLGHSMPNTLAMLNRIRPTGKDQNRIWETLTHANVGWAGLNHGGTTSPPPSTTTHSPTSAPTTHAATTAPPATTLSSGVTVQWTQTAGGLGHGVAAKGTHAWGANSASAVYRWSGSAWLHIASPALTQVAAAGDGSAWAVDSSQNIHRFSSATNKWTAVSGKLVQIDAASATLAVGVAANHTIFRYSGSSWTRLSGAAVWASVGTDGSLWVVGTDGAAHRWTGSGFTPAGGSGFVRIAVNSATEVVAVTSSGGMVQYHAGQWVSIGGVTGGGVHSAAVANGHLWATNAAGGIFTAAEPTSLARLDQSSSSSSSSSASSSSRTVVVIVVVVAVVAAVALVVVALMVLRWRHNTLEAATSAVAFQQMTN